MNLSDKQIFDWFDEIGVYKETNSRVPQASLRSSKDRCYESFDWNTSKAFRECGLSSTDTATEAIAWYRIYIQDFKEKRAKMESFEKFVVNRIKKMAESKGITEEDMLKELVMFELKNDNVG